MGGLRPPEKDIGPARASGWWAAAVAAALAALILAHALLDRLGLHGGQTAGAVTLLAIGAFTITGLLSPARRPADYHLADREIAPASGGMAAAAGSAGILLVGIVSGLLASAVAIVAAATGLLVGLALSALLIAPGLARFDGLTLGGFIDHRFGRSARLVMAGASFVASFILLVAVTSTAGPSLAAILGIGPEQGLLAATALMALAVLPGGMRSLNATQTIQYSLMAAGCFASVVTLAALDGGGGGAPVVLAGMLETFTDYPQGGGLPSAGAALLLMGVGAAALPQVSAQARCVSGSREGQATFVWAIILALALVIGGLLVTRLAAEVGDPIAGIIAGSPAAPFGSSVPALPAAIVGLVLAGTIGGLLAAGSAALLAASAVLGHDLLRPAKGRAGGAGPRVVATRICVVAVATAAWIAAHPAVDAGALLGWALAFAAAGLFAPLVLGLWWRGCSAAGAALGSAAGSGLCAAMFLLDMAAAGRSDGAGGSVNAAALGLVAAFLVSTVVSLAEAARSGPAGSRVQAPSGSPQTAVPRRMRRPRGR